MYLEYEIDEKILSVKTPDETQFFKGKHICLSTIHDVTKNTNWYKKGYLIKDFSKTISFQKIKESVTNSIKKIIQENYPDISLKGFALENYHKYISPERHFLLDKLYKRLYPKDLGFYDQNILLFISNLVKKDLTYTDQINKFNHWIIVRINMPESTGTYGYNPAHKDIYEDYDERNCIPKMVNTWIPICGVNKKTGLPIAIGSHLIKESDILRTKSGSIIDDQKYSVNCVKSWAGQNKLVTMSPKEGELLIFSSHMIHGLGKNYNIDTTRVSLEFRLHEKF